MAYIYAAELWCDKCGGDIRARLEDERDIKDAESGADRELDYEPKELDTGDSDDYPQSAGEDGGESDTPGHCAGCHVPLSNSLTSDGVEYVLEAIRQSLRDGKARRNAVYAHHDNEEHYYKGSRACEVVRDWAEQLSNYGLDKKDAALVDKYLSWTAA